jgi:hypothetical protein
MRVTIAVALLCAALTGRAAAMSVLPLDLGRLTGDAGRIFVGRVERVDAGRDASGLPAVWTTFAVDETLKGAADARVTLKQLGATFGAGGRIAPQVGLPRYAVGESVVLFVHPESPLGFTSPVGLGQGVFRIHEHDGQRVVENDVGNRNLTSDASGARALATAPSGAAAEPLPLDTLVGRVRALVAGIP